MQTLNCDAILPELVSESIRYVVPFRELAGSGGALALLGACLAPINMEEISYLLRIN